MKITFLGLSSFLIENKYGHKILIDPFNDAPRYNFGINFPKTINNQRLTAELVLLSHLDADHASFRPEVSIEPLGKIDHKKLEYNIRFPNLNLCGVLVREWNGFLNIAWSYTIDGWRLWHLADNAHILTNKQIQEAGKVDILFISPSKMPNDNKTTLANIKKVSPKFVVWSHHLPVQPQNETNENKIRSYFKKIILAQKSNPRADQGTVELFTNFLQNIFALNKKFQKVFLIDKPTFIIPLKKPNNQPSILFFRTTAVK